MTNLITATDFPTISKSLIRASIRDLCVCVSVSVFALFCSCVYTCMCRYMYAYIRSRVAPTGDWSWHCGAPSDACGELTLGPQDLMSWRDTSLQLCTPEAELPTVYMCVSVSTCVCTSTVCVASVQEKHPDLVRNCNNDCVCVCVCVCECVFVKPL